MPDFRLQFPIQDLKRWTSQNQIVDPWKPEYSDTIKQRGYMEREEFLQLCKWKSPRTQPHCASNSADLIKEVTKIAFSTSSEQLRIQTLTLLEGVGWPTASAILHFCAEDKFPILDFRALWSLSIEQPPIYDFAFWWEYTVFCRDLANSQAMTMRELDKALWQYSKKNQVA